MDLRRESLRPAPFLYSRRKDASVLLGSFLVVQFLSE
jgi:hypothetical protein